MDTNWKDRNAAAIRQAMRANRLFKDRCVALGLDYEAVEQSLAAMVEIEAAAEETAAP